jgi:hypothetical protein
VRSKAATADLALARLAGSNRPAVFIDHADAKRRHGEAQVAAAGQERQLDAHHGQAAQFHHAVAVQSTGGMRRPPATGAARRTSAALPNFRGQMIAGREPHAHAPEPAGSGLLLTSRANMAGTPTTAVMP